jgi:hypothetical protein
MFVSVTIASFVGFIAGLFVCLLWRRAFCIDCHNKDFSIKKLQQENGMLRDSIAMIQARKVQQIKKKLERLRNKKKG